MRVDVDSFFNIAWFSGGSSLNNCVQFTTFYMQRFTTVLRKMQTSIFLLLVIVMDSIKSNLSVNFVEGRRIVNR